MRVGDGQGIAGQLNDDTPLAPLPQDQVGRSVRFL